jgi:hypothetical protein
MTVQCSGALVKKLLALTLFLVVALTGGAASAMPRWYRGDARQVTVWFERTHVSSTNWAYVKSAAARWGKSDRIAIRLTTRCPHRNYCVKVYEGRWPSSRAGVAVLNYDPASGYAWYGSIRLNDLWLTSAAARRKVTCHEMGHALGLDHRYDGHSCMRDGFGTMHGAPDGADYARLHARYATR